MKLQPNRDYISNDDVQTPCKLAEILVNHFHPMGNILEPCKGEGNFLKYLPEDTEWCEIKEGKDFFDYKEVNINWIITNPPWSLLRKFLIKSMRVADNVVFLVTINHLWTSARQRDIKAANFGIKEIVLLKMPKSFP